MRRSIATTAVLLLVACSDDVPAPVAPPSQLDVALKSIASPPAKQPPNPLMQALDAMATAATAPPPPLPADDPLFLAAGDLCVRLDWRQLALDEIATENRYAIDTGGGMVDRQKIYNLQKSIRSIDEFIDNDRQFFTSQGYAVPDCSGWSVEIIRKCLRIGFCGTYLENTCTNWVTEYTYATKHPGEFNCKTSDVKRLLKAYDAYVNPRPKKSGKRHR